ncbi:MAG: hypothetical protein ACP5LW_01130 [Nitrososphaeria archaeon]
MSGEAHQLITADALLREITLKFGAQLKRTFWISTSMVVRADAVVRSVAFCLTPSVPALRRRAIKFLGYHCIALDPAGIRASLAERYVELVETLGPLPRRISEILPRSSIERLSDEEEVLVLEAARQTSRIPTSRLQAELLGTAERVFPGISRRQAAMDKLVLTDLGYFMGSPGRGAIDYAQAADRLCAMREIMRELFGPEGPVTVSNLFTLTAPNFIKNLLVLGGPRVSPGILSIESYEEFVENVQLFSEEMGRCGIYLDLEETKKEICSWRNRNLIQKKYGWINNICAQLVSSD